MQLEKSYGTTVHPNPCSELKGGQITNAIVFETRNRDWYIDNDIQNIKDLKTYNTRKMQVCAETNNQR